MSDDVRLKDLDSLLETMEARWGEPFPFDREMWSLCGDRARDLISRGDYGGMRDLYLHMAQFLGREGRDCRCLLEEAARAQLLSLRGSSVAEVVVRCADGACPLCLQGSGLRFGVEEALSAMPIPHRGCTCTDPVSPKCAFCRCEYVASDRTGP